MAQYFSKYPSVYYSFDDYKTSDYITNILSRFSLQKDLKENTSVLIAKPYRRIIPLKYTIPKVSLS
jgi:hypothetical protein